MYTKTIIRYSISSVYGIFNTQFRLKFELSDSSLNVVQLMPQ